MRGSRSANSELGTRAESYRTCEFSNPKVTLGILNGVFDHLICVATAVVLLFELGLDLNVLLHGLLTVQCVLGTLGTFYESGPGQSSVGLRVHSAVALVQTVRNGTERNNFIYLLAAGAQAILALTTVYSSLLFTYGAHALRAQEFATTTRHHKKKDGCYKGSSKLTRNGTRRSVLEQVINSFFRCGAFMLPWLKTLAHASPTVVRLDQPLSSTPLQGTAPLDVPDEELITPVLDETAVLDLSSPSTDFASVPSEQELDVTRVGSAVSEATDDDIVPPTQTSKHKSSSYSFKTKNKRSNLQSVRSLQMAEPPMTATLAEVEEAYKRAAAEQQRLEQEMAICKSPEFMRKQFACQTAQNTTGRLLMRLTSLQGHGELDTRLKEVESRQGAYDENLGKVHGVANQAAAAAARAALKADEAADAVRFLEAGYQTMRRDVERIDSKQRSKNVVVIGLQRGDPTAAIKKLLDGKHELLRNVDDAFFMSKKPGRRPMLVTFITKFACEEFLKMSHGAEFTKKFANVIVVRDRSEVRRTGMSRIAASAARLRIAFPEITIHQHSEFVAVSGQKVDAVEFVASAVKIDGVVFDIDEACDASETHEVNEYLYARVGDIFVFGYKKKGSGEGRLDVTESEEEDDEEREAGDKVGSSSSRLPRAAKSAAAAANAANARPRKRAAATSGTTSGGVRIQYGPRDHERRENPLVMGAVEDPYDRRRSSNVR